MFKDLIMILITCFIARVYLKIFVYPGIFNINMLKIYLSMHILYDIFLFTKLIFLLFLLQNMLIPKSKFYRLNLQCVNICYFIL